MELAEALELVQQKAAATLGVEAVTLDTPFASIAPDSLAVVELTLDLEEAFGTVLTEVDVRSSGTLGELLGKAVHSLPA